jgi:hypothetical protein
MDELKKFQNLLVINKTNFTLEKRIEEDDEIEHHDKDYKIIFSNNSNLIMAEEYEKLFDKKTNEINKKRTNEQMNNINSNNLIKKNNESNNIGKKIKYSSNIPANNIDLKKKNSMYSNWTVIKIEEEIKKFEKNIEELNANNDEKKEKEIKKFEKLYEKWVKISQDTVYNILEMFPENQNYQKNTIKSLIQHFKIDKELIKYDSEEECFE